MQTGQQHKKSQTRRQRIIKAVVLCLFVLSSVLFAANDAFLYKTPIGRITAVNTTEKSDAGEDEPHYEQQLTLTLENGARRGQTVTVQNEYSASQFKTSRYRKGTELFLSLNEENGTAVILNVKRDVIWALLLSLFLSLLFLVAGRRSLLILASLAMNLIVFVFGMNLLSGENHILLLTAALTILFVAGTMLILNGTSKISRGSILSSLLTIGLVTALYALILKFTPAPSYEFQAYSIGNEALRDLYLASLLFGILGAVMDVAITINAAVAEIFRTSPDIDLPHLTKSVGRIASDIMGTMISVLLFTFLSGELPVSVLKLANDYALVTLLKYGTELEMIRFLLGAFGIVLAIPISGAVATLLHRKRGAA